MRARVVVAMSGGVDSSVAAALLKEKGFDVLGITMQVWPRSLKDPDYGDCCSLRSVRDARQVACSLGIPFYALNFEEIFENKVISYFCQEYKKAKTPNPCIRCNQEIKFNALLEKARQFDAEYLATGHYARIDHGDKGRNLLKRGLDQEKDQSYALYTLTQKQLAHILFPLGDYSKDEVRNLAKRWGLFVHDREDSQEICFIPNNDYREFLRERDSTLEREGPILDMEGRRLGVHKGLAFYTIGQRKGLGISTPTPKYVVMMDLERNALIVGENEDCYREGLVARDVHWIAFPHLSQPREVMAQIRYNTKAHKAQVEEIDGEGVKVTFHDKQRAITPGQAVVFYDGDVLLGGGTIEKSFG